MEIIIYATALLALLLIYSLIKLIIRIVKTKWKLKLRVIEWVIIGITSIIFLAVFISRAIYPDGNKYEIIKGPFPDNIEKIVYLNGEGNSIITEIDCRGNEKRILLSEYPQELNNVNYYASRIYYENGDIYIVHKNNRNDDLIKYIIKEDKASMIEETHLNEIGNKFAFNVKNSRGTNTYHNFDILMQDNYYNIFLLQTMPDRKMAWNPIKYEDKIYLFLSGKIYEVNKDYQWRKIVTSSMNFVDPKTKCGTHNIQVYNNKLFILYQVFYPEFFTKYINYFHNLILFKMIRYLKVIDINTKHVIKKIVFPSVIDSYYGNFRVYSDTSIIIDGKYIFDYKNKKIIKFNNSMDRKRIADFFIIYKN